MSVGPHFIKVDLPKRCFLIKNSPPATAGCRNVVNNKGHLTIGFKHGQHRQAWKLVLDVLGYGEDGLPLARPRLDSFGSDVAMAGSPEVGAVDDEEAPPEVLAGSSTDVFYPLSEERRAELFAPRILFNLPRPEWPARATAGTVVPSTKILCRPVWNCDLARLRDETRRKKKARYASDAV